MSDDFLKSAWAAQPLDDVNDGTGGGAAGERGGRPAPDLQGSTARLERKLRRRNLIEYAAGAFVIAMFGRDAWLAPNVVLLAGNLLIVLGTLFLLWQLGRRASARLPGAEALTLDCRSYLRRSLERQRDALRSVWLWYLLPLVPGFAVLRWGRHVAGAPFWPTVIADLILVAVLGGIAWVNKLGARRLQAQINALDASIEGDVA